jgi:hypothetical protein
MPATNLDSTSAVSEMGHLCEFARRNQDLSSESETRLFNFWRCFGRGSFGAVRSFFLMFDPLGTSVMAGIFAGEVMLIKMGQPGGERSTVQRESVDLSLKIRLNLEGIQSIRAYPCSQVVK